MARGPYLTPEKIERRVLKARELINSGLPKWKALKLAKVPRSTYYRRIERAMSSDHYFEMSRGRVLVACRP